MNKPSLDPGRLRHRLAIEFQNEISDGCGGFITNWQLVAQVWGAIEPVSQSQISRTDNQTSLVTFRITIRWRADCAAQMRFVKSGRTFNILSATDPDQTGRYLVCNCEEVK